jgi:peptidoglycan-associated lipoprotein
MKRIFWIFFALILFSACSVEKKAQRSFNLGQYESTIEYYQGVLKKDPNSVRANYYIAESYRLSNRIKLAEPYYKLAIEKGNRAEQDSMRLMYVQALKTNQQYDLAKVQLQQLYNSTSNDFLKQRAVQEIEGINYILSLEEKENYYRVRNLEAINTPAAEYAPVYRDGELYFTSSRNNSKIYEATGTPFTDLYTAKTRGANVDASTIKALPEWINTPNVNEGTVTFSPDGNTMIFAKGNSGKRKGAEEVDLYISNYRNGQWTEPRPININDPGSWDSTPAFSPDGRTLYFASNRRGGYGGTDLYSAQYSRGRFGRVRNLGPEINTPGNEMFPYVAEDGNLYFSSDGHPGYGGLDIFVVKRSSGRSVIENLGKPVNSSSDDFGIFLFNVDRGFFASNREGGKGDDDIYTFINEDPNLKVVNYFLQGITMTIDAEDQKQILANTRVELIGENGELMQDFVTGNDGKFLFRVYENEDYTLVGERDGYFTTRELYTTKGKSVPLDQLKELVTNITLDTILVLEKKELNKIFVLQNIYYDLDKWDIRPDAALELNKLVTILDDNPEIKIELSSHTDSRQTDDYNLRLSQRRAESAVNYLISRGIPSNRMVAKGYGESRLLNQCKDGVECSEEEHQKNRRTEFKILEIGIAPKRTGDDFDEDFDEDKYFRRDG